MSTFSETSLPADVLRPISTLPPDASHDTVQLYQDAKSSYGMRAAPGGVEECIMTCPRAGDNRHHTFLADVEGAKYWCVRQRPRMQFPKFT